jgi:N-acetyl-anhydromuramyl-L-alanine amidase AmpD
MKSRVLAILGTLALCLALLIGNIKGSWAVQSIADFTTHHPPGILLAQAKWATPSGIPVVGCQLRPKLNPPRPNIETSFTQGQLTLARFRRPASAPISQASMPEAPIPEAPIAETPIARPIVSSSSDRQTPTLTKSKTRSRVNARDRYSRRQMLPQPGADKQPIAQPIPQQVAQPIAQPINQPSDRPKPKASNRPVQPAKTSVSDRKSTPKYAPREEVALANPTNFGERYLQDINGQPVDNAPIIVIHETVIPAWQTVRAFQTYHPQDEDQASYHALIKMDGTIFYMVPPDKRAFGAGNSVFNGEAVKTNRLYSASVNNFAYHISFETPPDGRNNGNYHSGYTDLQYESLAWLAARTGVPESRITYHKAVDRSGSRKDPRSYDPRKFQQRFNLYPKTQEIMIGCPAQAMRSSY